MKLNLAENKKVLILLGLFLLLALGYVFKVLNKTKSAATNIPAKPATDSVPPGESEGVPSGFPSDFPQMERAKVTSLWSSAAETTRGASLVWEIETPPKEVFEFYKNELLLQGWQVEIVSESDSSYTLSFAKENYTGSCPYDSCLANGFMGIVKGDNTTVISTTVGIRKK